MFYYEIPWSYQDFKSEILCFLNMYSVYAARILDLSLRSSQVLPNEERNTFTTLKALMPKLVKYFYFLETKFINAFKMC